MSSSSDRPSFLDATLPSDDEPEPVAVDVDATQHGQAPREPSQSPEAALTHIGRFEVRRRIGAGAMGVVLQAHDPRVDRAVAIKLLRTEDDAKERARLEREAHALARLSHPNVVQVFEVGTHGRRSFLVMELVDGQPLDEWLRVQARSAAEILDVLEQAGQGLAAAHAADLVHRDFKPSNALVGHDGRVRVLDFGLARSAGADDDSVSVGTTDEPDPIFSRSLTRTGAMMGTPAYMAPEQHAGLPASAQSDQFAFCVALYEALYEQHPFSDAKTWQELVAAVVGSDPRRPPDRADVPARVRRAVLRGLARAPDRRWPSMDALLEQLRLARRPARWPRWAAALAVPLVAGSAWLALRDGRDPAAALCSGADAKLEEVWGPGPRQRVRAAMIATELSYAEETWSHVEPRLDDHARRWADAHTVSCEAAARGELSAELLDDRMACLERRRRALGAQVEILAHADPTVVEQAVQAVQGLPDPSTCASEGSTVAVAPEQAAWAEEVEQRIEQAEALDRSGKYEAGLAAAEALLRDAEAHDYPPARARALLWHGRFQVRQGAIEAAATSFEQAYFLAQELGLADVTRHAAIELMDVTVRLEDYERGAEWARHAKAELDRGGTPLDRADHLDGVGLLELARGDFEDALAHLQEGLALRRAELGDDHLELSTSLGNVGIALRRLGRNDEAVAHQEQALAIVERVQGRRHPARSTALRNLAAAYYSARREEDAQRASREAIAVFEAAQGRDHPDLAGAYNNLAIILSTSGKLDEAEAAMKRALEIAQGVEGMAHFRSQLTGNLAYVQQQDHRYDEAEQTYRRAIAMYEAEGLGDHPDLSTLHTNLGDMLTDAVRPEPAEHAYERALELVPAEYPAMYEIKPRLGLAGLALADGRHARAAEQLDRLAVLLERDGVDHVFRRRHEFLRLRLAWETTPDRRDEILAQARTLAETLTADPDAPKLAQRVQAWVDERSAAAPDDGVSARASE